MLQYDFVLQQICFWIIDFFRNAIHLELRTENLIFEELLLFHRGLFAPSAFQRGLSTAMPSPTHASSSLSRILAQGLNVLHPSSAHRQQLALWSNLSLILTSH